MARDPVDVLEIQFEEAVSFLQLPLEESYA